VDQQLYVRIENKSLIPFFDPAREASRRLTLTTIKDNQRTAVVTIYRKDPAGAEIELKRYTVGPIPLAKAGAPKISLEAVKLSSRKAEIRLSLNRRSVAVDTLRLPSSGGRARWLLVPLALLLLAAFAVLILPSRSSGGSGPAESASAQKSAAAAPQKPRPNPAPLPKTLKSEPAAVPQVRGTEPPPLSAPLPAAESADVPESEPQAAPAAESPRVPPEPVRALVYFGPDSAELSPQAAAALRGLLPELRRYPDAHLSIRGHCAPRGTEKGRRELSEARAEQVASFLRQAGIKVENSRVIGLGAREPVSLLEKDEHLNRRVEIILEGA
jgi:outer membrane protein OmpA-like peptidoglycan-associated protein